MPSPVWEGRWADFRQPWNRPALRDRPSWAARVRAECVRHGAPRALFGPQPAVGSVGPLASCCRSAFPGRVQFAEGFGAAEEVVLPEAPAPGSFLAGQWEPSLEGERSEWFVVSCWKLPAGCLPPGGPPPLGDSRILLPGSVVPAFSSKLPKQSPIAPSV